MRLLSLFLSLFLSSSLFAQTNMHEKSALEQNDSLNQHIRVKAAQVNYDVEQTINVEESVFQTEVEEKTNEGKLTEIKDNEIDLLILDYLDNKVNVGYRIQLFSGNSRWEAVKVKTDFMNKYNDEASPHLIYQSPNFKIRVGDYHNRLEAQRNLEIYKVDYPSAFLVKDEIEIKK